MPPSIWTFLFGCIALLGGLSGFIQAESRILVGADDAQLQAWVDQATADKLQPLWVQAVTVQRQPRFCAIADSDQKSRSWSMRHNLTPAEFQTEFERLAKDGYQLSCWTGYLRDQKDQIAAIWVKHDEGGYWHALSQMSPVQFQEKLEEMRNNRELPWQITHYATKSPRIDLRILSRSA